MLVVYYVFSIYLYSQNFRPWVNYIASYSECPVAFLTICTYSNWRSTLSILLHVFLTYYYEIFRLVLLVISFTYFSYALLICFSVYLRFV